MADPMPEYICFLCGRPLDNNGNCIECDFLTLTEKAWEMNQELIELREAVDRVGVAGK